MKVSKVTSSWAGRSARRGLRFRSGFWFDILLNLWLKIQIVIKRHLKFSSKTISNPDSNKPSPSSSPKSKSAARSKRRARSGMRVENQILFFFFFNNFWNFIFVNFQFWNFIFSNSLPQFPKRCLPRGFRGEFRWEGSGGG